MIKSMTGFGRREAQIIPTGKFCVELRSSNHKFLEIMLHMPPGFLSLEERIKKEIEAKLTRGRVTCAINISGAQPAKVFINKSLLKDYLSEFKKLEQEFAVKDGLSLETLIHLPGVLSLVETNAADTQIWPRLKILVNQALDDLSKARVKEGMALYAHLKRRAEQLLRDTRIIKERFKRVAKEKAGKFELDEEKASFLKSADISEEVERLSFHARNFLQRLSKNAPIGKELDFIAQEMQREANTLGAKSVDTFISGKVVKIKSEIEKMREQAQNIE